MNSLKGQNEQCDMFIEQFLRDLYMDDETTAVDDIEVGKKFYDFSRKALAEAGLDLRKWNSNSSELRNYMNCEDDGKDVRKLLGILYNNNDEFLFDLVCKKKYGWSDDVDDELRNGWMKYIDKLREIKCIRIPR